MAQILLKLEILCRKQIQECRCCIILQLQAFKDKANLHTNIRRWHYSLFCSLSHLVGGAACPPETPGKWLSAWWHPSTCGLCRQSTWERPVHILYSARSQNPCPTRKAEFHTDLCPHPPRRDFSSSGSLHAFSRQLSVLNLGSTV